MRRNTFKLMNDVVKSTTKSAAEMTHALSALGNGNMGAGIRRLCGVSQLVGIMEGASVVALIGSAMIKGKMIVPFTHNTSEPTNGVAQTAISTQESNKKPEDDNPPTPDTVGKSEK